jgi:urea transport system substrate-binding protein
MGRNKLFAAGALAALVISAIAAFILLRPSSKPVVRVGVLHSLSGTMAISETVLKEVALMTFDQINAEGGILGQKIEAIVVDPASDWPKFAQLTKRLLTEDKVAAIFGCWTSVSRKHALTPLEDLNGLLFYPVQYEGEELSKNVFYTGAAPNQQAIPAVDYLLSAAGGGAKRIVLLGTDYVYPRTTNKILRAYLKSKGVGEQDVIEEYHPFGFSDWSPTIDRIVAFAGAGKRTAIVSTINGDSNVSFYEKLSAARINATGIPSVAFSVGEQELASLTGRKPTGHLAAWNYFMSTQSPANERFKADWAAWAKKRNLPNAGNAITNDPMEATIIGIRLWKKAVEKAQSFDVDKVRAAIGGLSIDAPSGFTVKMDETNHHLHKPVFIGEIEPNGQFKTVFRSPGAIRAQPWSPYVEGNANRKESPDGRTADAVR